MSDVIVGVIIGGSLTFISGFIIESFKQKKEKKKFKKEKIEKLYFEYLNWVKSISRIYSLFIYYIELGNTIEEARRKVADAEEKNGFIKNSNENNIIFLMNLYFPELNSKFEEINDLSAELASSLMDNNIKNLNIEDFKKTYTDFLENIEKFKKDIISLSNRIGRC